ncbi:MAG: DNA topology modulation protein [Bacteroidota bacterium]
MNNHKALSKVKKILIIGSGGAGKSTFARQLHRITGLPLIHLDQKYWQPNWEMPDRLEWTEQVKDLVQQEAWIMDGNYSSTLDIRLAAADLVIFLDRPTYLCFYRVLKRTWRNHGRTRSDMTRDCPDRFDLEFLHYVLMYNWVRRPTILEKLEAWKEKVAVRRLKSDREVEAFLEGMK